MHMTGTPAVRSTFVVLSILAGPLHSEAQIWSGAGSNDKWTTPQNWSEGIAPLSSPTVAVVFQGTVRPTPFVDTNAPWVLNRIEFQSQANPAANIFTLSGNQLSFQGAMPRIYNYSSAGQIINNDIDVPTSDLQLKALAGSRITLNGHVSGAGGLLISTEVQLGNENTYQGTTEAGISSITGHILLTHPKGLGSTNAGTIVHVSSNLRVAGGITVDPEPLSLTANGWGEGLVNYSGNNTWTGNIIIVGHGAIFSKNPGETFNITGAIDGGNAGLQVGGPGDIVISGSISGMPNSYLSKYGTGTLTLTGANAMNAIDVADGVLVVMTQQAVAPSAYVQLNPNTGNVNINAYPTLRIQEDMTIGGLAGDYVSGGIAMVDLGSHNLTIDQNFFASFGGQVLGTGSLIKSGAGVLALTIINQYAGVISINGGGLRIFQDSDLGAVPPVPTEKITMSGGGRLEALSYYSVVLDANRTIRLVGTGELTSYLASSNSFIVPGQITGPGTLKTRGPLVRLSNANNNYSGGTTVQSGVLQFDSSGSIGGTGPNVLITYGAVATAAYPIDQNFLGRIDPTSPGTVGLNAQDGNDLDFGAAGLTSAYFGALGGQIFRGTLGAASGLYRLGGCSGVLELTKRNALSGSAWLLVEYATGATGTVMLSNDNTLNARVLVQNGTLKVNGSTLAFTEADDWGTINLANATLTGTTVTVEQTGYLTGCGTINADLVNNGQVSVNCGDLVVNGNITNNGTMSLYGGTVLIANGSFVNNGVLDLLTSPNTVLPPGFVNNGTVIQFGQAKVQSISRAGSTFTMVVQSLSGHNYQLQRSPILPAANWQNVGTAKPGTGADISLTDSSTGRMFYRLQISP
jgi:fibronectin-binding autotransporter adhesin